MNFLKCGRPVSLEACLLCNDVEVNQMENETYSFHRAVKLKYRDGVKLDVYFEDGLVKRFDMSSLYDSYPPFKALEDRTLFESGKLYTYLIVWNDFLDIEVEEIYENGVTIRQVKPFPNVNVGRAIGFARASRMISQAELAEKAGMDQSDISKIERGVANPSMNTLRKLADALDCDLVVRLEPKDPHDPDFYPPDDEQ